MVCTQMVNARTAVGQESLNINKHLICNKMDLELKKRPGLSEKNINKDWRHLKYRHGEEWKTLDGWIK